MRLHRRVLEEGRSDMAMRPGREGGGLPPSFGGSPGAGRDEAAAREACHRIAFQLNKAQIDRFDLLGNAVPALTEVTGRLQDLVGAYARDYDDTPELRMAQDALAAAIKDARILSDHGWALGTTEIHLLLHRAANRAQEALDTLEQIKQGGTDSS